MIRLVSLVPKVSPENSCFQELLSWLESLLEAHYANFIVSKDPDSANVLERALDLMTNLDSSINLLATVMAQSQIMKKKLAIRQAKTMNAMYSVEVIHL